MIVIMSQAGWPLSFRVPDSYSFLIMLLQFDEQKDITVARIVSYTDTSIQMQSPILSHIPVFGVCRVFQG
jgi:hypothetical protein